MIIYLCVKQHSITGMLYFCKTTRNDPEKYLGSGKYWKRHLKKHGASFVKTLKVWKFEDQIKCVNFAKRFSNFYGIVNASNWANIIEENGLDGAPKGIKFNDSHKENMRGKVRSKEHYQKLSMNHAKPNLGKKFSKKTRMKMSKNNVGFKGKTHKDLSKLKISTSCKGKTATNWKNKTCPHCGLSGKGPNMTRYHFDSCKVFAQK